MQRLTWVAALMSIVLTACGAGQENQTLQVLGNHTPQVVSGAQVTGVVNPEQQLQLRVVLPLQDENQLDSFLVDLYDPQSTSYGQYLTPDEFTARYTPDANTVAQVRAALLANGFQVDDEAHGTLLGATANAADAEAFFHTQLSTYVDAHGQTFYAPDGTLAVVQGLPIKGVFGMHTTFPHHAGYRVSAVAQQKAASQFLNAAKIRKAYNIPSTATGSGQVIALYELDAYVASDIAGYAATNGIPEPPLKNILIDNFSGTVQDTGAQGEVTLDIELVNAMDPNAQQIRVYEAANSGNGEYRRMNEIANPTLGDKVLVSLVSTSWGLAENEIGLAELLNEGAIFKQMAAQGQTVFAASGDKGAKSDGSTVVVDDPASQPWVVGVGGTTLTNDAGTGTYQGEAAWSGSGGGISSLWSIPTWQKAAITAASKGSIAMRNVPDVALDADPSTGYTIFLDGKSQSGVSGTSCAAPLWAGFFGLVNQARAQNALPPMGFAAPALYLVGGSVAYASDFHDVTRGNNGVYSAVAGYDEATGWGSFNGANLLQTLSNGYGRSIFSAPMGLAFE